jgi:transcriptional regulator with XRE-family HTH domain
MAPKGHTRLESGTQLAFVRHRTGVPQIDMARRMGVSIATYQRLEEGRMPNPPLGYLVNASIILGVPVAALIEPGWLSWWDLGAGAQAPTPRRDARWK